MGMSGTSGEAVPDGSSAAPTAGDCPEIPYADASGSELLLDEGSGPYEGLTPLYKRLPHGPHGLGREAVARHQRARLYGGMVESVYQRGYAGSRALQQQSP